MHLPALDYPSHDLFDADAESDGALPGVSHHWFGRGRDVDISLYNPGAAEVVMEHRQVLDRGKRSGWGRIGDIVTVSMDIEMFAGPGTEYRVRILAAGTEPVGLTVESSNPSSLAGHPSSHDALRRSQGFTLEQGLVIANPGTGTGPEGPRGPPGSDGLPGLRGAPGANGLDGSKGDRGERGPQGPRGFEGQTGPQGPPGAGTGTGTGERGPQGIQGPPGARGDAGPQGLTGPQGAPASTAITDALLQRIQALEADNGGGAAPTLSWLDVDGPDVGGTSSGLAGRSVTVIGPGGTTRTATIASNGTWAVSFPSATPTGSMSATATASDGRGANAGSVTYRGRRDAPTLAWTDTEGLTVGGVSSGLVGQQVTVRAPDGSFSYATVRGDGTWSTTLDDRIPGGAISADASATDGQSASTGAATYTPPNTQPEPDGYPMRFQLTQDQIDNGIRLPRVTDQADIILKFDAAGDDEADPGREFTVSGSLLRLAGDLKLRSIPGDWVDVDVRS